ncbi:uncharacterized protein LOC104585133 [Brachypodium distachyon]|uniref:uncharacterized protein LOC104585133 n=1 Tax=Brachypodium distachyon TaxID=15368 RepID=UPI0001C711F2|nr:uncharacterized protein LOC104585133 [Brachypodium distachyon]|eukprot:XP_014758038.1 uncharacterized protein LOC104585133 [Brachypodium distachyon]
MTSLAVGCGLAELWMLGGGLFTAAELAAAELLLQLSVGEAEASPATTTTCSWRSESSCSEDLAAEEEEERVVEESGSPLGSTTTTVEMDTRATKRYRLLSELYAATSPVNPAAAKKKRKRRQDESPPPPPSSWKATRYDGDYRD